LLNNDRSWTCCPPSPVLPQTSRTTPRRRTALLRDLAALYAIAAETLIHDRDSDAVVDLLWAATRDQPTLRIVAEADGVPVGFALASLRPASDTTPCTGPYRPADGTPRYQGKDLSRALLEQTQDALVAAGAARLMIRGNPRTTPGPESTSATPPPSAWPNPADTSAKRRA
jgi:hypothetical protein